jgi:hypothetical protein
VLWSWRIRFGSIANVIAPKQSQSATMLRKCHSVYSIIAGQNPSLSVIARAALPPNFLHLICLEAGSADPKIGAIVHKWRQDFRIGAGQKSIHKAQLLAVNCLFSRTRNQNCSKI